MGRAVVLVVLVDLNIRRKEASNLVSWRTARRRIMFKHKRNPKINLKKTIVASRHQRLSLNRR